MKHAMFTKTAATVALAMLWMTSAAGSPGAEPGEQLVASFVTDVETLASRFEQRLVDADGELVEVSTGTLSIQRPGRFRWAYAEPYEQWLVADGTNVWSYDVDLAQVTVKPQSEALANTPALLLGGSDSALDGFDYDGSYEADGIQVVRMLPRDLDSGFKRVELAFLHGELTRMVFLDNLEQMTIVMLYDVITNEPIDPETFRFVIPDDVDVVGTPAVAHTEDSQPR